MQIKACIFDLDGVLVDTAKYHFISWRRLAQELGIEFTEKDNHQLKGVSRIGSLEHILKMGDLEKSEDEKKALAKRKNSWYLEHIDQMSNNEILPGSLEFLDSIRKKGLKIALGSGSKNARLILDKIGLLNSFDAIVDGTDTTHSKPDPEVFLKAANILNVQPDQAIVFEDAYKGIQAAKAGGFKAIGIGQKDDLPNADLVFSSLAGIEFLELVAFYSTMISP